MKSAIIITIYNLDSFIEKQIHLFRHFNNENNNTHIIAVNNSSDEDMRRSIKDKSKPIADVYIETHSESSGSDSHAFALNFAFTQFKDTYKSLFFADHDIFPYTPFSIERELLDMQFAGIQQMRDHDGEKYHYFHPGCLMINMDKIDKNQVDFKPDKVHGLDTGGRLYKLARDNKYYLFEERHIQNPHFSTPPYDFYSIINTGAGSNFIHFINSSNWAKNYPEYHEERMRSLIKILDQKLNET